MRPFVDFSMENGFALIGIRHARYGVPGEVPGWKLCVVILGVEVGVWKKPVPREFNHPGGTP